MSGRKGEKSIVLGITVLIFLLCSYSAVLAEANVVGFIYSRDGATPLAGAVVKFRNLTTGVVYEGTKSDANGTFYLQGIESGIYNFGVLTEDGNYNAENVVGLKIQDKMTAKLTISIHPYEKEVAAAVSEIYHEQEANGESLVGTIAEFSPHTKLAQVQVLKGLLRLSDRIHTKGKATDFYQDVSVLKVGESSARQLLKGETGYVQMEQKSTPGDLVYVVSNKKIFPFFLAPVGLAAIIGGNSAVSYGKVKITDKTEPVSAFKRN